MDKDIIVKAKLTTPIGTFEFEGTRDFVEKETAKITSKLEAIPLQPIPSKNEQISIQNQIENAKIIKRSKFKTAVLEQPKLLANLIVDPLKIKELKDFVNTKKPAGHLERFLVLSYWMKTNLHLDEVSIDEMWTAYKMLVEKPPRILIQVFRDGKSKKGWFTNGSKSGKYKVTPIGETFVEHDLSISNSKNE